MNRRRDRSARIARVRRQDAVDAAHQRGAAVDHAVEDAEDLGVDAAHADGATMPSVCAA